MFNSVTTDIDYCKTLLQKGELVAIPTETVYGLAANAFDEKAVQKIFELKERPLFNPLIVHIHQLEQLEQLAKNIPGSARKLAEKFWPGPLTLILPKKGIVGDLITAGKPTVGIRMPNHELTLKLLRKLDFPLVAPSANPFTRISPTTAEHVVGYFGEKIGAILDGGPCQVGLESTIVGFEKGQPVIYRKGGIAIESIEAVVGPVKLMAKAEKDTPVAPGMLLKHYSPKTRLLLTHDLDTALTEITEAKIGVLAFKREKFDNVSHIKTLSPSGNFNEAAQNLFQYLYELDNQNLDIIVAEKLPEVGLGLTINDRLERAKFRET